MNEYEPLRQFVELTRTLHFGRAARACHVSPSTLSRSVQRLEEQLGQQLFEREHHKVTFTPGGEQFRRHALAVLDEWHHYQQERAEHHGELYGSIHVYCTVTAAQSIVPDLLGRLRRAHPDIRIELQTGYACDAIEQLRGGDIDATIAALPARLPTGIAHREVTTTPVVFVAPSVEGPIRDLITPASGSTGEPSRLSYLPTGSHATTSMNGSSVATSHPTSTPRSKATRRSSPSAAESASSRNSSLKKVPCAIASPSSA